MNRIELSSEEEAFISALTSKADELIHQFLEENPPAVDSQNLLLSVDLQREKERLRLKESFNLREIAEHIKNAQKLLEDHHIKLDKVVLPSDQTEESDKTLQELLEIPEEKIQEVYHLGTELFDKKCYEDAADIFFYLTQLNPFYANVWIAIGLCFQKLQKHQQAIGSFETAIQLDREQPDPYIYCIECYKAIKDYENAEAMKNIVLPLIEKHPYKREYRSLLT